jgi:hypothetical protein
MWIQAHRDPHKEWLQPRYCVNEDDIEMAMRDWHDDWRVPVLTQEVPPSTEADTTTPKKSTKPGKPTQNMTQQTKGSALKKNTLVAQRDTSPQQKEQGSGATKMQETPSTSNP